MNDTTKLSTNDIASIVATPVAGLVFFLTPMVKLPESHDIASALYFYIVAGCFAVVVGAPFFWTSKFLINKFRK